MPKGSIAHDTFEQLAELGVSTVKKTATSLKKTASPSDYFQEIMGNKPSGPSAGNEVHKEVGSHSKIDLKEIGAGHDKQDKEKDTVKEQEVRAHLFRLVKEGEQKTLHEQKREEQEKQEKEHVEAQEKKKKEEEKNIADNAGELPKGKKYRSIFNPKKVAARQGVETRASSGKQ